MPVSVLGLSDPDITLRYADLFLFSFYYFLFFPPQNKTLSGGGIAAGKNEVCSLKKNRNKTSVSRSE